MGSKTIKLNTGGGKTEFELSPSDVDLGKVPNVKQNLTATRDPTSSDDTDSGYSIGSRWVNTSSDAEFVCLDASSGAAVWIETTQSGGSSGGGLTWQVISSNTTASAGNGYLADVSSGTLTITLPSSPTEGDQVAVCDYYSNSGTNNITVARNGSNIEGYAADFLIDIDGAGVTFVYSDSTRGWEMTNEVSGSGTASGGGDVTQDEFDTLQDRVAANAFTALTNGDIAVREWVDGFVDVYEDESEVDTTASSHITHNSTGEYYTPEYGSTVQDLDETQSEFQNGTLTDVEADAGDYLRLADTDVLDSDGMDDYVNCGNVSLGQVFSIEIMAKSPGDGNFNVLASTYYNYSSGTHGMRFWIESDGTFIIDVGDGSTMVKLEYSSSLYDDAWHRLGCTVDMDNGNMSLFIDGSEVASDTNLSTLTIDHGDFWIGQAENYYSSYSERSFYGQLSDCRVWSDIRTQTEIQDNMHKRLNGDETGLVAYYKLDEGSGDTAIDSAGSNDGTINGATWVESDGGLPYYTVDGNRTHQVDLSNVGSVDSSSINWTETLNSQSITIETRVSYDGGSTWSSWQTCTNGGSIPNLSSGDDVSNGLLECRQNLSTSDATSTPELSKLDIKVNSQPHDMVLISTVVTVETEPGEARLVGEVKFVDSITLNTDLLGYVSKDGGSTWDQVTLEKVSDYGSQVLVAGTVPLSSSGLDLAYKWETANNVTLQLHATADLGD